MIKLKLSPGVVIAAERVTMLISPLSAEASEPVGASALVKASVVVGVSAVLDASLLVGASVLVEVAVLIVASVVGDSVLTDLIDARSIWKVEFIHV